MKILITILLAALPALASAQAVSTLELVENLSVTAGSSSDLAVVRDNASRPFSASVNAGIPPVVPMPGQPVVNPPINAGPVPADHWTNNHGFPPGSGHGYPPVIVDPGYPYGPGHGGVVVPGGPSHDHTEPVVSGPVNTTTVVIIAAVVIAVVLLAILL